MEKNAERIAILPGSYDPITKGHVALAERAVRLFDRVIVAVMQNSEKEYLFSSSQRLALARASLEDLPHCEVIFDSGMLIDLYARVGASCVVKGLRNAADYQYESVQAEWNREHLSSFETDYLPSPDALSLVSSTEVRRRLCNGDVVEDLLMPKAYALLKSDEFRRLS